MKAAQDVLAARDAAAREQMLAVQRAKQAAWDAKHQAGQGSGPRPQDEVAVRSPSKVGSAPRASTTDPDSRRMKAKHGFVQGYNVQLAVTDSQVIVGAQVTQTATDHHLLPGVIDATTASLADAGIGDRLDVVLADSGYANEDTFTVAEARNLTLLAPIVSDEHRARGTTPGQSRDLSRLPATARAQEQLRTVEGQQQYAQRGRTVEPVFGQLKDRLGLRQFSRRGLPAVTAELIFGATVHNLRKLHRWNPAPAIA